MPYNFVADSFHTKKLCTRLSSSEVGATHDDNLRLIEKCVVDFLLVLIELFRKVLRLKRYSTCPVASGILQRRAGRSSSFHAGTVPASPARSRTRRSGSQAA